MFDKEKQKLRMQPVVNKLITYLKTKGIEFIGNDGEFENVIFKKDDKEAKICHHWFYRYSGIACIYKDGEQQNQIETITVTDEMFMNMFMKPVVESHFK